MSTNANIARARRIARRIRSSREIDGPFSPCGRLRPTHIDACATILASLYTTDLTDAELQRAVVSYASQHPDSCMTYAEAEQARRKALVDAANLKTEVVAIDRRVLENLSSREKLEFANEGKLPSRIVVTGTNNA